MASSGRRHHPFRYRHKYFSPIARRLAGRQADAESLEAHSRVDARGRRSRDDRRLSQLPRNRRKSALTRHAGRGSTARFLFTLRRSARNSRRIFSADCRRLRSSRACRTRRPMAPPARRQRGAGEGADGVELLAKMPPEEGGHPLLVVGGFGAGRTLAWMSDIGPHWLPASFVEWPGYRRLWINVLSWVTRLT